MVTLALWIDKLGLTDPDTVAGHVLTLSKVWAWI